MSINNDKNIWSEWNIAPRDIMEKTKNLMYLIILSGIANIIFNILLIPYFALLGAALATLFSYLLYLVFSQ